MSWRKLVDAWGEKYGWTAHYITHEMSLLAVMAMQAGGEREISYEEAVEISRRKKKI